MEHVVSAVKQMLPSAVADCIAALSRETVTSTLAQEPTPVQPIAVQPMPVKPMAAMTAQVDDDEQGYSGLDWDFIGG